MKFNALVIIVCSIITASLAVPGGRPKLAEVEEELKSVMRFVIRRSIYSNSCILEVYGTRDVSGWSEGAMS